jgi:hypothetical protein
VAIASLFFVLSRTVCDHDKAQVAYRFLAFFLLIAMVRRKVRFLIVDIRLKNTKRKLCFINKFSILNFVRIVLLPPQVFPGNYCIYIYSISKIKFEPQIAHQVNDV